MACLFLICFCELHYTLSLPYPAENAKKAAYEILFSQAASVLILMLFSLFDP